MASSALGGAGPPQGLVARKVTDDHIRLVADAYGSHLRSVNLLGNKKVGDAGLAELGNRCHGLADLSLCNCTGFTDQGLVSIARLSGLRKLNLTSCRTVTDLGLSAVAAGCKALEELSLKWASGITSRGVALVALNLKKLRLLDLSYTEVQQHPT
eukprot:SM004906S17369  [mRNA]  locus=s4906:210:1123:+ [translate_table: standard]